MHFSPKFVFPIIALAASLALPTVARADFSGFGNFSGFNINVLDSGSAPTISGSTLNLINSSYQSRSVFNKTPQTITQFTASFTYIATGSNYGNPGACFVLENNTAGAAAVTNGSFAYSGMTGRSAAVTLEFYNSTGYYTNGTIGGGSGSTSPVNIASGNPINVTIRYDGSFIYESLVDTVTSASFDVSYIMLTPLPTLLGGNTAYVGITAGSSYYSANQSFSNFQFTSGSVPEPASLSVLALGGVALLARRRRRG